MKSLFEEHGGKYIQCGDYLIPDLGLTEQEQKPLGKYGILRLIKMGCAYNILIMNKKGSYHARPL